MPKHVSDEASRGCIIHTQGRHVFAGLHRKETNKGNLHAGQRSESIPRRVANVKTGAVSAHADQNEGVHGQEAGNEDIATPRGDHVAVEDGAQRSPQHGTKLESLDPEEEGKDEKENGDGLVVVAAGDGSRDVTGRNAHEDGSKKASRRRLGHLVGQEVGGVGRKAGEGGREKHANVSDIDGDGDGAESMVDGAAGDHQARIEGASGNPTERIPCSIIEPVPKLVESIGNKVFRRAEVEPRVDCGVSVHQDGMRWLRMDAMGCDGEDGHSWIMLSNPKSWLAECSRVHVACRAQIGPARQRDVS